MGFFCSGGGGDSIWRASLITPSGPSGVKGSGSQPACQPARGGSGVKERGVRRGQGEEGGKDAAWSNSAFACGRASSDSLELRC